MESDEKALLRMLSERVSAAPLENRCAVLRALDVSLSLLNTRAALPHAAEWFFAQRTVAEKELDPYDPFWASRVTPEAAAELRELVPRLVVLYGEFRHCELVGNSSAEWTYSALALLPEPADDARQASLVEQLYEEVAAQQDAYHLRSENICFHAYMRAPDNAALRFRYVLENPDARQGHYMMRLDFDCEEVVTYWPALEGSDYNWVDFDMLSETCEQLGLRHVLPLQLATFLTVVACATANHTESWGADQAVYLFEGTRIPDALKRLAEETGEDSDCEDEESDDASLAPECERTDESDGGKRRIPLLVPPQRSIGQNGLLMVVYVRSDEDQPRVWWAADEQEVADIERFCKAAESFDINDPSTHVVEF